METGATHDGSTLLGTGCDSARGLCTVCSQPLPGPQAYWITGYPHGEHLRCRRWNSLPFPFERRLGVLRRVWRATPAARAQVATVGAWLKDVARRWPQDASAELVEQMLRELRGLQTTLATLDVDRKLLSQL